MLASYGLIILRQLQDSRLGVAQAATSGHLRRCNLSRLWPFYFVIRYLVRARIILFSATLCPGFEPGLLPKGSAQGVLWIQASHLAPTTVYVKTELSTLSRVFSTRNARTYSSVCSSVPALSSLALGACPVSRNNFPNCQIACSLRYCLLRYVVNILYLYCVVNNFFVFAAKNFLLERCLLRCPVFIQYALPAVNCFFGLAQITGLFYPTVEASVLHKSGILSRLGCIALVFLEILSVPVSVLLCTMKKPSRFIGRVLKLLNFRRSQLREPSVHRLPAGLLPCPHPNITVASAKVIEFANPLVVFYLSFYCILFIFF